VIDLHEQFKLNLNLLANDGIHWPPQGHRLITQCMIKCLSQIPKQNHLIDTTSQSSSIENINNNEIISSSMFT